MVSVSFLPSTNWDPITITLLSLLTILFLTPVLKSYFRLRHIPGPTVAAWTDAWRLLDVWNRRAERTHLRMHERYGDVVRLGPNCVSVCLPNVVERIYGIGRGFVKSDFYYVWHNVVDGKRVPSPVFMIDEAKHAQIKRPIAPAYQLSKLVEFESFVDSTTAAFFTRLDELVTADDSKHQQKPIDLGTWLQLYAFDVIGELTFSKRLGFLERGSDVEGVIASIARNFDRNSVLGQMPWLDLVTFKSPIYLRFFAPVIQSPIMAFGNRRMQERLEAFTKGEIDNERNEIDIDITDPGLQLKGGKTSELSKLDFLSRFLSAKESHPDVVNDKQILAYLFMNVNAGSDTISATLRAVFYYLLKHPSTLSKLRSELDTAVAESRISPLFVTWSEAQSLPYLGAVIKEALRLHPALALLLERVVPPDGLQLPDKNNTFLPPGTIVGINPWILHRDTRIFGSDAKMWNPDRWLTANKDHLRRMESNLLSFGAGKRSCLGKNIAMLELHKIVPALLLRYEMRLAEPEKEWEVRNSFIFTQKGLDVFLERRKGSSSR